MKKIILGLVVILTVGMATAQEQKTYGFAKNDVVLGGSLRGHRFNRNDKVYNFGIYFYPSIAYFIKDNFAVGTNLSMGYSKSEAKNINENDNMKHLSEHISKTNTYGARIFGRYYFWELGKRFKVYNQLSLGYHKQTLKYESKSETVFKNTKINPRNSDLQEQKRYEKIYDTSMGLGVNFFISQNFILTAYLGQLIGYSYTKYENDYILHKENNESYKDYKNRDTSKKDFNFKLNSHNLSFGIAYKF